MHFIVARMVLVARPNFENVHDPKVAPIADWMSAAVGLRAMHVLLESFCLLSVLISLAVRPPPETLTIDPVVTHTALAEVVAVDFGAATADAATSAIQAPAIKYFIT